MRFLALATVLALNWGAADDQATCLVRGKILGHDGKPLPKALARRAMAAGPRAAITDRDGRFTLDLPRPGGHLLEVAGVYHESLLLPVMVEPSRPLEVEIRLRTVEYLDRFDTVRVLGDFNDYSPETAVPMTRLGDGTFSATIECQAESLRYQLLGLARDGSPTAGTQADTFFYRGRWIASVPAGRKPVRIDFDPARLPRSNAEPVVRFADPRAEAGSVYPLFRAHAERRRRMGEAYSVHQAAGGAPDGFHWDWSSERTAVRAQLEREPNATRRQYLMLNYFGMQPGEEDSALARRALREVPPDSPLWSLEIGGPLGAFYGLWKAASRPEAVRAYAERMAEAHPDTTVRGALLFHLLGEAHEAGDRQRAGRFYTRLVEEISAFPWADWARKQYAPNRAIQMGRPAPEIAFAGLEDSTVAYRTSDFRGKHLLLDFWAVWCAPCVAEMRHLHAAHEKYGDRGLAILSVSFDRTRRDVARFRAGKWPMPWRHAFAAEGFESQAAREFEIAGIPRPVLLDPEGRIAALDVELRGENLKRTLERILGGESEGKR